MLLENLMLLGLAIFSYLLGSISTAIVACRLLGFPDPRSAGSRNPGATNVLRIAGKKAAIITLIGDVCKGLFPIVLGRALHQDSVTLSIMGVMAFLGHLYPVFFGFEGGKGVATALGVIHVLAWPVALVIDGMWFCVAILFRYSSLAALVSWGLAPAVCYVLAPEYVWAVSFMSGFLWFRHRENIQKLRAGTEKKIGG